MHGAVRKLSNGGWRSAIVVTVMTLGVAASGAAKPVTIRVDLDDHAGASMAPVVATLELRIESWSGEWQGPLEQKIDVLVPGSATVDLPTRSRLRLRLVGDSVYMPPRVLTVEAGQVEVMASPAVRFEVHFGWAPDISRPSLAMVRGTAVAKGEPGFTTGCPVGESILRCVTPAGVYDLAIDLGLGLAPIEKWGVTLPDDSSRDLGLVVVQPAVTVRGRVEAESGSLPDGVVVELQPLPDFPNVDGSQTDDRRIFDVAIRQLPVPATGEFVFDKVAPGWYIVRGDAPGYADHGSGPFVVHAGSLEPRLVKLMPRVDVEATIVPPVPPGGGHWTIALESRVDFTRPAVSGEADDDGHWTQSAMAAGGYQMTVAAPFPKAGTDQSTRTRATAEVDVQPGMAPLEVRVPVPAEANCSAELGASPAQDPPGAGNDEKRY
jgi:hypothetical protein